MSEPKRVCVFYSLGIEFDQIVKSIRNAYPDAHLTALVPSVYTDPAAVAPHVDEAKRTKHASYPTTRPWRIIGLIREIRRERFDVFVVIFFSFKLRLFAALSNAYEAYCWALDGRVIPLEKNVPAVLWDIAKQTVAGWWRYTRVWLNVHLARAGK